MCRIYMNTGKPIVVHEPVEVFFRFPKKLFASVFSPVWNVYSHSFLCLLNAVTSFIHCALAWSRFCLSHKVSH